MVSAITYPEMFFQCEIQFIQIIVTRLIVNIITKQMLSFVQLFLLQCAVLVNTKLCINNKFSAQVHPTTCYSTHKTLLLPMEVTNVLFTDKG